MILNFFKFNIVVLNLTVIIWCILCSNAYRLQIENSYQVPGNLFFNRAFFLMILNSYVDILSFISIILNLGREKEYKLYYLINFIFGSSISVIDFLEYVKCDDQCQDLLGGDNLYHADTLTKYLSLFHLLIIINYISWGLTLLLSNIDRTPLQLTKLYTDDISDTNMLTFVDDE